MVPVTVPLVLEDLGRLLHRWRRPVLATWAVVVVLGAVLGGSVFDLAEAPDPLRDDSESAQVKDRLEAADPEGELVVAVLSGADIYGVDLIDQATRTLHAVRDLPDVVEVRDPSTTGARSPPPRRSRRPCSRSACRRCWWAAPCSPRRPSASRPCRMRHAARASRSSCWWWSSLSRSAGWASACCRWRPRSARSAWPCWHWRAWRG